MSVAKSARRRVPVVIQQSPNECGAACLSMVLAHFGRPTSVAACAEVCGSGRDGASAHALVQAARRFELRARAFSSPSADLSAVPLPAIVHWNFTHFVVVERWDSDAVDIVDPASGRRRVSHADFGASFTGVVLTFEPGEHFERRARDDAFSWRDYVTVALRTPGIGGALSQIAVASLVLQALGLSVALFTKLIVDQVLPFGLSELVGVLALGALLWIVAQTLTTWLRSALLVHVQGKLDAQLMLAFFEHLLSLPFKFFQQRTSGDLLLRLGSNLVLRELLTTQSVAAVLDAVLVLTYWIALVVIAPTYALLALGLGALQVVLVLATTPHIMRLMQRDLQAQSDTQSFTVEALNGIATLKASGVEARTLDQWQNLFFKQLNVSLQRNQTSALIEAATGALRTLAPLSFLLVGAQQVLGGELSLGTMLALNALAAAFLAPLGSLVASFQSFQLARAHFERIADVLETASEQRQSEGSVVSKLEGRFELEHVSFRYAAHAPLVIDDVTLSIRPGAKVALVGRTGSGKSTLARLLLGLYEPTSGRITCDGRPLAEWNLGSLRRRCGVVLQEPFVFAGTIRENIVLHDALMSDDEIVRAAQLALLSEDIDALPMGYDTLLAEGGGGLSGGQRQRLALARALAHRPDVLLLDEATSHLDVITEALVDDNLSALSCTRIVIAHRLSTIRNADVIVVLDQGRIVEHGTHGELLAAHGAYAQLVQQQLESEPA